MAKTEHERKVAEAASDMAKTMLPHLAGLNAMQATEAMGDLIGMFLVMQSEVLDLPPHTAIDLIKRRAIVTSAGLLEHRRNKRNEAGVLDA